GPRPLPWPSLDVEMALELSLDDLLANLGLDPLLGVHLLQPAVLGLELLEAGHQRGIHAAELGSPLVERRTAHAVLAAQVGNRGAGLGLLEYGEDLVVAKA